MKHLRRFNESNIDALDELKDFCESNLAFLLDDKIQISYSYYPNYARVSREMTKQENIMDLDIYKVQIKNIESVFDEVYWDDIKDYFIPFLERLSSVTYKRQGWFDSDDIVMIRSIKLQGTRFTKVTNTYDYYDIEKDRVREDKFWSLSIKVEI